jgi:HlyD family type I secretion membrane fusion protein
VHFSLQGNDQSIEEIRKQELNLLSTRIEHDQSRQLILQQRRNQLERQIEGFHKQLQSIRRQQELIVEEKTSVQKLVERGLEKRPRLLALERAEAVLFGTEGELLAQIARTEEAIGESELQAINLRISRLEEVDEALSRIQAERIELESQYHDRIDRFDRTIVTAPVAGTVIGLRFRTLGGVIRPGEPILDIVPNDEALVIEARVSPTDIDDVRLGLAAYVMFPSYALRHMKRIDGEVVSLSADVIEDERTGERYYSAEITVERELLESIAPDIELTPGLPAQVFISTEERTFLDYLLQPVILSFERSFRES